MMPKENLTQKFERRQFQQRVPYVIYADFECALLPFSMADRDLNLGQSYTDKKHHHKPTSYCYYVVCANDADPIDYKPKVYRGADAVQHFWKSIRSEVEAISEIYQKIVCASLKADEYEEYWQNISSCHICGIALSKDDCTEGNPKRPVLDHDHLTGEVRGWACLTCNFTYRLPNFVPIVFHNGSSYDFKLIIREIHLACNIDANLGKRVRQSDTQRNAKKPKLDMVSNLENTFDDDEDFMEMDDEEAEILGYGTDLADQDIVEDTDNRQQR